MGGRAAAIIGVDPLPYLKNVGYQTMKGLFDERFVVRRLEIPDLMWMRWITRLFYWPLLLAACVGSFNVDRRMLGILAACAFVSIGTNDLAQYALAADRQLGGLAALQDPWHPALLRLVAIVGEAGQRAGKPVGVCGEAAADPLLACVLVGLGVTSLSMAAPALADVREELATRTVEECRELARLALATGSAASAREAAAGR